MFRSPLTQRTKMIVEQAVTNDVLDMGLLQQTAEPARQILDVETIDVVADKGYFKSEDIAACEKAGLTPHVPKPQRGAAVANGFFRKDEFRYDAAQDAYVCPGRHELKPIRQGRLRDMRKVDYANARACRDCPLRPRCTNNYRAVSRLENEDALDRMAARLGQRPDILARRREIVEHPFGTIKQWMNQGAFLMRGLDKVRAEFSLTALVYNLRRSRCSWNRRISSAVAVPGERFKYAANRLQLLMWLLCVCGVSLRALMSSILRWRRGLMASVLMGNSPE